jgi:hypothetical protein
LDTRTAIELHYNKIKGRHKDEIPEGEVAKRNAHF